MADWSSFTPLLSAIVGASAAVAGVLVSSITARKLAEQNDEAAVRRELRTHLRQERTRLKTQLLEDSIALHSLTTCFNSVAWLGHAPMNETYERGHSIIARIEYVSTLLALKDERSRRILTLPLSIQFNSLYGAAFLFKEQIALGNIQGSGKANEQAKAAERVILQQTSEWENMLKELQASVTLLLQEQE